jgi:hypothetical protein
VAAEVKDGRLQIEQIPHQRIDRHRPLCADLEIVTTSGHLQLTLDRRALAISASHPAPRRDTPTL